MMTTHLKRTIKNNVISSSSYYMLYKAYHHMIRFIKQPILMTSYTRVRKTKYMLARIQYKELKNVALTIH